MSLCFYSANGGIVIILFFYLASPQMTEPLARKRADRASLRYGRGADRASLRYWRGTERAALRNWGWADMAQGLRGGGEVADRFLLGTKYTSPQLYFKFPFFLMRRSRKCFFLSQIRGALLCFFIGCASILRCRFILCIIIKTEKTITNIFIQFCLTIWRFITFHFSSEILKSSFVFLVQIC